MPKGLRKPEGSVPILWAGDFARLRAREIEIEMEIRRQIARAVALVGASEERRQDAAKVFVRRKIEQQQKTE